MAVVFLVSNGTLRVTDCDKLTGIDVYFVRVCVLVFCCFVLQSKQQYVYLLNFFFCVLRSFKNQKNGVCPLCLGFQCFGVFLVAGCWAPGCAAGNSALPRVSDANRRQDGTAGCANRLTSQVCTEVLLFLSSTFTCSW